MHHPLSTVRGLAPRQPFSAVNSCPIVSGDEPTTAGPAATALSLAILALAGLTSTRAEAADFTVQDPALTIPEMTAAVVGNSWSGTFDGADFKEYIDPKGELRGTSGGAPYVAHWFFRQDGIFCFDYGEKGMDPGQDGCVQLLQKGEEIGWRRLDGLVEGKATLAKGNAFGL